MVLDQLICMMRPGWNEERANAQWWFLTHVLIPYEDKPTSFEYIQNLTQLAMDVKDNDSIDPHPGDGSPAMVSSGSLVCMHSCVRVCLCACLALADSVSAVYEHDILPRQHRA